MQVQKAAGFAGEEALATPTVGEASVVYGAAEPVESGPVALGEGAELAYGVEAQFPFASREALVHALANTPLCVNLFAGEGEEKKAVGTVTLDLLPLLFGQAEVGGPAVAVELMPSEEEGALQLKDSKVEVRVTTFGSFVPDEGKGTVLEIKPTVVDAVPEGMAQAAEEHAEALGGGLAVTLSVKVPELRAVTCAAGILRDGKVVWEAPATRVYVPEALTEALVDGLEAHPVTVELARYLPAEAELADPAFESYHAVAEFSLKDMVVPGETALVPPAAPLTATGEGGALKPSETEAGKEFEAAPEEGAPQCAWEACGAKLEVAFSTSLPLRAPWQPPPKPEKTLEELIPARPKRKPEDAVDVGAEFKAKCQVVARDLAGKFGAMFEGTPSSEAEAADRKKKIVFELNKTGKYLELKDALKESIVKIVKDKYRRSGAMTKREMQDIYNDVYMYLVDEMHVALATLFNQREEVVEKTPDAALAELKALAAEYEVNEQWDLAEKLHQERIVSANDTHLPGVWYDFATFCMRRGDLAKAEEAFRESIAIDSTRPDSLLGLACLLTSIGIREHGDEAAIKDAETLVQSALKLEEGSMMIWALITLIYKMRGMKVEKDNAHYKTRLLAQAAKEDGMARLDVSPFLQVCVFCLDLSLPALADKAIAMQPRSDDGLTVDILICKSRIGMLKGKNTDAVALIESAVKVAAADDTRPYVLLGILMQKTGHVANAIGALSAAIAKSPTGCPLEVFLKLGALLVAENRLEEALDVYTQGCAARPCSSTWLGAGVAYFKRGEYEKADIAMREANICDTHNALVWGWLALVATTTDRIPEAETALKWAYREGLEDAALLNELGTLLHSKGQFRLAESSIRRSLAALDAQHTRCLLGDALLEQADFEGAGEEYAVALEGSPTAAVAQHAAKGLQIVQKKLGIVPGRA